MKVGFTGTREGMNAEQAQRVTEILRELRADIFESEFLHGNCIGADEQAAMIAGNLGYKLIAYPCNIPNMQSRIISHVSQPVEQPLVRNRHIVRDCDILIAAPKEHFEPEPRPGQGTWSTVRYTRKQNLKRKCVIVWPDGKTKTEIESDGY